MNTILITGASSGIGRATARHFAQQGWNVVATMRAPERETELNTLERVLVVRLDVEQPETIERAVSLGIERFGRIDVLLNNAGYAAFGVFEAAEPAQIKRQFDVNVFGTMRAVQAILPHFRANGAGTIINVSSVGGRVAFPLLSLYHASKWAIEGFSESLYYELGTQKIQVKVVEPGNVSTDFTGRSLELLSGESLPSYRDYAEAVTKKQLDSFQANASAPERIAETIYEAANDAGGRFRYLAGDDAAFLMGARAERTEEEFMGFIAANFR
ncbi:SDR family oxidoreductase [Cohnella sp. REN36]|uniref:SDR family oxidoreductase n=1 Tax=Cohnella sp. REN36 TaxID=2887347 RepID=UPI001D1570DC|nr:SDR family oxidoreductase [Cohnella sp. REN36]MCC3375068.1 SDR family oxidoreductase [Cohnella sp. REN36]